MAKRKLEENAVTACCDEGKAKKRHRKFWTPEERGKVRPWVAELMILSDIDSNKRGGAQWFKEQRKKVLSMAPEEWRQRIQDIKFKANTKTVHGASADELIEEIEPAFRSTASPAVPPDRKASTAAPPPAAPATPACSVPAPVQNRSPHSSREPAGRGIERYFNVKCSLAVAVAPRPHPKRLSLHAGPGRDHYAVLRLHKSCSMQQVHAAYKQRALETHPDKGGSHDEFLAVKEAFEILSDYAKRAQLDGQAFAYERPSQSPDYTRFLLSELLLKKLPKELLTHVDLPTLRALKSLLAEMRDRQRTEGRRRLEPVQKKGNGLVKCANGDYLVTISWNNFRLQVSHIKDLQMATNIHSAFVQLRETAKDRIKRAMARRSSEGDEEPALTDEELLAAQAEQPYMILFASDFRRKWQETDSEDETIAIPSGSHDRWMSPWTPNLATALAFRRQMRDQLGRRGKSAARFDDKKNMQDLAQKEREAWIKYEEELELSVVAALQRAEGDEALRPMGEDFKPLALQAEHYVKKAFYLEAKVEKRTAMVSILQKKLSEAEAKFENEKEQRLLAESVALAENRKVNDLKRQQMARNVAVEKIQTERINRRLAEIRGAVRPCI